MAKKLNQQDLLKLTSIGTPPTDSVAFAAKSDGLYQKVGTTESKLSTTAELLDRVKTPVPEGAKFTDTNTVYTHPTAHPISFITGLQSALDGKSAISHTHTFASLTNKPTTLAGYGLTEIETNLRTTTSGLTVLGVDAALNLTGNGGQGSTVFGYKAAESAVGAGWFTAIGRNAGQFNVSGYRWSAFGQNAGQNNISGSDWLAFGVNAGRYNTTGENWTAIGVEAGYSSTTGGMWTAIGSGAGWSNTTGQGWLAIGVAAGTSNLASNYWTAIGAQAGNENESGSSWTAVGFDAARYNKIGNAWTAIGTSAASSSDGSFFTAIGLQAGQHNSSNEWVAIGFKAAENLPNGTSPALSASNSVHIGSRVKVSANNVTNEIAIGYNVIGKGSNTVVIGNDDITKTYLNGEVYASLTGNATTATTATKLGTATVGSTQLPFYLNAGTATAITQANLRKGLFGTTAIGSTTQPIYIAANGVPAAITGSIANSTTGSAATLTTTRAINGTNFDGSTAITTSRWGTSRNIGVVNSDGTGTAVTTSVNGSEDVNLKLPSTIKASLTGNASSATNCSRSVVAGNGLTGGGALSANRTLTLGTPSAITLSSTDSVATSSHTHSLALGGTASQYLNGATTLVTIPTITAGNGLSGGGQLTASRTVTLGTPGTLSASSTSAVTATSHTHLITTTSTGAVNTIVQTDAGGNIVASGEITAHTASDKRLKKNITNLSSPLDILDKLRPVTYNWNDKAKELNSNKTDDLDYGLIAQEVEEVLPEIVHNIYEEEYKSIDYLKLVPLLVGSVKELKERVEYLEKELKNK